MASGPINAEAILAQIRIAEGHPELAGHVSLLDKLVLTMSEGTLVAELTEVVVKPVFADLCLLLLFVGGLVVKVWLIGVALGGLVMGTEYGVNSLWEKLGWQR